MIMTGWAVMTGWTAMNDWASEQISKLLPLPPLPPLLPPEAEYEYDAKLNETLQRGQKAMAAAMNPLPELERLYRQGGELQLSLSVVAQDYRHLWDVSNTKNQTIIDGYEQLKAVRKHAREPVQSGLAAMQRKLVKSIGWASDDINTTVRYVSRVLRLPDDEVVRIYGPQEAYLGLVQAFFYRLRTTTPDPQLIRDRTVWRAVCDSQAYLMRLNKRLLKKGLQVAKLVKTNQEYFEPVRDSMHKEVHDRMATANATIVDVHNSFNTSIQKWSASSANRWYNSSDFWMSGVGWLLNGQKPPVLPHADLAALRKTMGNLGSAEGQLIFTWAIMDDIIKQLEHSRHQIELADVGGPITDPDDNEATDPDDDDATDPDDDGATVEHPCSLLLANTYNSTYAIRKSKRSPLETLHILSKQVTAFREKLLKWDGEPTWDPKEFQDVVNQTKEQMRRNR